MVFTSVTINFRVFDNSEMNVSFLYSTFCSTLRFSANSSSVISLYVTFLNKIKTSNYTEINYSEGEKDWFIRTSKWKGIVFIFSLLCLHPLPWDHSFPCHQAEFSPALTSTTLCSPVMPKRHFTTERVTQSMWVLLFGPGSPSHVRADHCHKEMGGSSLFSPSFASWSPGIQPSRFMHRVIIADHLNAE